MKKRSLSEKEDGELHASTSSSADGCGRLRKKRTWAAGRVTAHSAADCDKDDEDYKPC